MTFMRLNLLYNRKMMQQNIYDHLIMCLLRNNQTFLDNPLLWYSLISQLNIFSSSKVSQDDSSNAPKWLYSSNQIPFTTYLLRYWTSELGVPLVHLEGYTRSFIVAVYFISVMWMKSKESWGRIKCVFHLSLLYRYLAAFLINVNDK